MGRSRMLVGLLCTLALGFMSCGREASSSKGAPQPNEAPNKAVVAVQQFDAAALEASLDRLDGASFSEPTVLVQLAPLFSEQDLTRRWAAVYLASLLVDEKHAGLLRPVLRDPDPALRVIAAGALAGRGVVESLPVLIEGLASERQIPYADPPGRISVLAREALVAYTGQSFATPAEWEAWWNRSGKSLAWNGQRYAPK